MSGRGRGRSGGRGERGRGQQPSPAGGRGGERGRGQQPSPAGGRGGGRGRGQQPSPAGGRGGGRGAGRGRGSYDQNAPSQPPSSAHLPSSSSAQAPSVSTLSRDLEQKLNVGSSSVSAQPSSSSAGEQKNLPPASSKASRIPVRPGYGSAGRRCVVRANHFLVEVADRDLHHYDVSITPEMTSKKVCRQILGQLVTNYKQSHLGNRMLAYDGRKSAYSAGPLPFASKDFVIKLQDEGARKEREFKVSLKFAAKVDLFHLQQFLRSRQLDAPQETIQALDVVLRETPSINYEVVGRSFFSPELGQIGALGQGLEYWQGFYQSLRPTQMGLSLNIDISARAFYEPILVTDFVSKYLNIRYSTKPLSDQDRTKVRKALRGIKVEISHLQSVKRYKITGISTQPLKELSFPLDESGLNISVVQYFRDKYNILLKNVSWPALQAGNDAKPVLLPLEVCKIVEGQRYTKKLNEYQVTSLLNATCQRPDIREKNIKEMVDYNNYNGDPLVDQEFGIHVRPELTSIDARVLQPPMLKYHETGQESRVDPRVGQWNMINKKMINGGKVDFWTCVSFSRNLDADRFCQELIGMCSSKGMKFISKPLIPIQWPHPGQIEGALRNIHEQFTARLRSLVSTENMNPQLQLLIVILPDVPGSYGTIKRVCETELGIVSQCCRPKQASKFSKQYFENLALKINVKVGGRNTVLEQAIQRKINFLTDRPTIVFGADVTHPQPGEDASPSIAAVVASMDWPEVTKYRGLVSAQRHRDEIIQDLYKRSEDPGKGIVHGGMIRELLLAYYRSTKQKPHRIIFYRDGVSEGQFNQVLLYEMDAIRQACASLQEDYMPRVTFIVVQKRHHTRLFPAIHGDRHSTDKNGNILPGTVVDTKICHPTEFDFYLCSHASIKGTSRPAHYHVLYDENNFTADGLQTLTNNLCYTYARCTRSVSLVPPAYYAHLAAFRARYYIEGETSDSGSASGARASRETNREVPALPAIKDNVKEVMFYC